MGKDETKEIINIIPESFYDVLAYIVPGAYLLVDTSIVFNLFTIAEIKSVTSTNISWIIILLSSLIILGGLYYVGAILTTISYYLIQAPCSILLEKILDKNRSDYQFDLFEKIPLKLKNVSSPVGAELIKRYARLNLIRNIGMVALISIILLVFKWNITHFLISISVLIINLISILIRSKWLRNNIDKVTEIFNDIA